MYVVYQKSEPHQPDTLVGSSSSTTNKQNSDQAASVILVEFGRQCRAFQQRIGGSGSAATSFTYGNLSNTITTNSGRPWSALVDAVLRIGQLQVIRGCIAHELRVSSSVDAKLLSDCVKNLNDSILLDIANVNLGASTGGLGNADDSAEPATVVRMQETSPLLAAVTKLLDSLGFAEPMQKIYIDVNSSRSVPGWTHRVQQQVPALLFLFIVSQLGKLHAGGPTSPQLLVNTARSSGGAGDVYDAMVFVYGLVTLFRHVHAECVKSVVATLGRYIQSELWTAKHHATGGIPEEAAARTNNNDVELQNSPVALETLRIASQRDGAALVRLLQCLKRFGVIDDDMFETLIGSQLASLFAFAVVPTSTT